MRRILLTSKLGPSVVRRVGAGIMSSTENTTLLSAATNSASSTARRFITNDQEKNFQRAGIIDDQGMVVFDTLHELQVHSSILYSDNDLFGTFDDKTKSYHYMTYAEYRTKVNQCRTLLKDLGE